MQPAAHIGGLLLLRFSRSALFGLLLLASSGAGALRWGSAKLACALLWCDSLRSSTAGRPDNKKKVCQ
jgi:hypothetical protein